MLFAIFQLQVPQVVYAQPLPLIFIILQALLILLSQALQFFLTQPVISIAPLLPTSFIFITLAILIFLLPIYQVPLTKLLLLLLI